MNKPVKPATLFPDAEQIAKPSTALVVVPGADVAGSVHVGVEARAGRREHVQFNDPDYWSKSPDVILQEQPATAVYINTTGALVIRQEAAWDQDDDTYVFIAKSNQQAFLDKLCDVLGIMSAP